MSAGTERSTYADSVCTPRSTISASPGKQRDRRLNIMFSNVYFLQFFWAAPWWQTPRGVTKRRNVIFRYNRIGHGLTRVTLVAREYGTRLHGDRRRTGQVAPGQDRRRRDAAEAKPQSSRYLVTIRREIEMPSASKISLSRVSLIGSCASSDARIARNRAMTCGLEGALCAVDAALAQRSRAAITPCGPSIRNPFRTRLTVLA